MLEIVIVIYNIIKSCLELKREDEALVNGTPINGKILSSLVLT
jgi:hypothetical protein